MTLHPWLDVYSFYQLSSGAPTTPTNWKCKNEICLFRKASPIILASQTFCSILVNYNGGWWRWAPVSPDGVAPSWMLSVSVSVNLSLHHYHKVQKFSSGTGSPGWSRKKGRKTVVVWCGVVVN